MKYLFTTLLLLIGCVMRTWGAQELNNNGTFSYYAYNDHIEIRSYIGNGPRITIPETIENLPVTTLYKLFVSDDKSFVTDILIPSSIQKITSTVVSSAKNLKYIVIQSSEIQIVGSYYPFNLSSSSANTCIFIDGIPNISGNEMTGTGWKGSLSVSTKNKEENTISVYMKQYAKFSNTSFNYLIEALPLLGKNVEDIIQIDLKDLPIPASFSFKEAALSLPPGAKVKVGDNEYINERYIIDKEDFDAPTTSVTTSIHYSRANTKEWNSVCLPFPIKESDFLGDTRIYQMTSATEASINLTRIADHETVLPAGTPCFIYSDQDSWNLAINCTIPANVGPKTVQLEGWQLIGSFVNSGPLGTGKYKLNSAGNAFVQTTASSTVTAFRCYLQPTSSNAPARLSVNIDEEASITLVPNDGEPQQVKLYDLMGRERKAGEPGIFLRARTY